MRLAALGSLAALVALAAPPADAQVSQWFFDVQVKVPASPQAPGNETTALFTVLRSCSSPASVLPEQVVDVAVRTRGEALATGPGQVVFGEQACATTPQQAAEVRYAVRTPSNATPGDVYAFEALFQPRPGGTPSVSGPGNEATVAFTVAVAQSDGAAAAVAHVDETEGLEAPAVPALLLAVALLAAAFALRRR